MRKLFVTTLATEKKREAVEELVPENLTGWEVEAIPSRLLESTKSLPDVTLIEIDEGTELAKLRTMISRLVGLQMSIPSGSFVVFNLRKPKLALQAAEARKQEHHLQTIVEVITKNLGRFPHPERVDVVLLEKTNELALKLNLIEAKMATAPPHPATAPPRPSPLDNIAETLKATDDLRVESGRLSAVAIADVFKVSIGELATWLGRSRQSISKTPDADSLQNELAFFERVARIRAVIPVDSFPKWLRMENKALDNKRPLVLLARGKGQIVADLVDDMLTGAPA